MICLGAGFCPKQDLCVRIGCLREPDPRPIDRLDEPRPALHFVGFRGEEYWNAVKAFGLPDFVHRGWDRASATRDISDRRGALRPRRRRLRTVAVQLRRQRGAGRSGDAGEEGAGAGSPSGLLNRRIARAIVVRRHRLPPGSRSSEGEHRIGNAAIEVRALARAPAI